MHHRSLRTTIAGLPARITVRPPTSGKSSDGAGLLEHWPMRQQREYWVGHRERELIRGKDVHGLQVGEIARLPGSGPGLER